MTDHEALVAAVLAAPDDDVPRLVFADFLEENGDAELAAFVRAQVELARRPAWDAVAVRLRHAVPDAVGGGRWRRALPPLPFGCEWADEPCRRGFGWAVRLTTLTGLLESDGYPFYVAPVGELHLPTATLAEWGEVGQSWWMPRLERVRFTGIRTPVESVRMLCAVESGVRALRFDHASGYGMYDLMAGICGSPLGRRLRELELRVGGQWVEDILAELDAAPPPLERLSLVTMGLNENEYYRLAASPVLGGLSALALANERLAGEATWKLLGAAELGRLTDLTLRGMVGQDDSIGELAKCHHLGGLRRLDLSHTVVAAADAARLAAGPWGRLGSLILKRTGLTDAGLEPLTRAEWWPRLTELDLSANRLTDAGAAMLLRADVPPDLAAIVLDESFGDRERAALAAHFGDRLVWAGDA